MARRDILYIRIRLARSLVKSIRTKVVPLELFKEQLVNKQNRGQNSNKFRPRFCTLGGAKWGSALDPAHISRLNSGSGGMALSARLRTFP